MGKLRNVVITEQRIYEGPAHPESSNYDVACSMTVPDAVIDPVTGDTLSKTLKEYGQEVTAASTAAETAAKAAEKANSAASTAAENASEAAKSAAETAAKATAATIAVGTVTTGAAGTEASVVNSGTPNAAILDFRIPQGEQGTQGINLLKNTKTMNGYYNDSTGTITFDTCFDGSTIAKFAILSQSEYQSVSIKPNIDYSILRNKKVTVSLDIRSDYYAEINSDVNAGLLFNFCLYEKGGGSRQLYRDVYLFNRKLSDSWQRINYTAEITDEFFTNGTGVADNLPEFGINVFCLGVYPFEFKNVKLELGEVENPVWTPSPNDIFDQISTLSNPNLLDNWYFLDPINQRGKARFEQTEISYTIDRWKRTTPSGVALLDKQGLTAEGNSVFIRQLIENGSEYYGKMLTASALYKNRGLFSISAIYKEGYRFAMNANTWKFTYVNDDVQGDIIGAHIPVDDYLIAIKLELGSSQTLAHQDSEGIWVLNDPPPNKVLELLKCQRYQVVVKSSGGSYARYGFGSAFSTTQTYILIPLTVDMRASPTISYEGNFQVFNKANTFHTVSKIELDNCSTKFANLIVTAENLTEGETYFLAGYGDENAKIILDDNL